MLMPLEITPDQAAASLLSHATIVEQLNWYVDNYVGLAGLEDAKDVFLKPLNDKQWVNQERYPELVFEFEHHRFTFLSQCNAVEMMFGVSFEDRFCDALRHQLRELVAGRLEYWREVKTREEQEALNHELERQAVGA